MCRYLEDMLYYPSAIQKLINWGEGLLWLARHHHTWHVLLALHAWKTFYKYVQNRSGHYFVIFSALQNSISIYLNSEEYSKDLQLWWHQFQIPLISHTSRHGNFISKARDRKTIDLNGRLLKVKYTSSSCVEIRKQSIRKCSWEVTIKKFPQ